jgi:DNA-directed RNA polymerase subunit beta'
MERKKGLVSLLAGESPKTGFIQGKVWSKRQDVSARSTITLEPELNLDEVAIPYDIAKKVYRPFVIKNMKRYGIPTLAAYKEVQDETEIFKKVLQDTIKERPVLLNRAPSLHKHNVQAFKPVLVPGKDIKLNPLIVKGFNADFDGDTMAVHIPVTDKAVDEAWGMLPSRNVFKAGDNSLMHELGQAYQHGLYHLTLEGKDTKKKYDNVDKAVADGLKMTDMFTYKGRKTSLGRELANSVVPDEFKNYKKVFDGKYVDSVLREVANKYPGHFGKVISSLKDLGNRHSHSLGATLSITDLDIDARSVKDDIIREAESKLKKGTPEEVAKVYGEAVTKVKKRLREKYGKNNNFYSWVDSGAVDKEPQVVQILGMPGLVTDLKNRPIPIPITESFAEGLDTAGYWNHMYGARRGTIDRAVKTQESGALHKRLMSSMRDVIIVEEDCGTDEGLEFEVDDKNVLDRYLLEEVKALGDQGERNDLVDRFVAADAKKKGVKILKVRSPLTCKSSDGLCIKCYGLMPNGQPPSLGDNVGILDGSSVTERATQLTMRTFHTGGVAGEGEGVVSGYPRLEQVLKVPNTLPNKATLSEIDGMVDMIRKHIVGGYEVFVDGISHVIPPGIPVAVKKGDVVQKGDALSAGVIKPQELAKLKSFRDAQKYMIDELEGVMDKKFYRKTFETIVKGISNNAEVDDPGDSEYLPGDRLKTTFLEHINKKLRDQGKKPVTFKEYFKSIEMLGDDDPDWLNRLTNVHLKTAIKDMASTKMASNIHGTSSMPAYLYGLEYSQKRNLF